MKIYGVTHPIPKNLAERVYHQNKTVFVAKSYRGKVTKGDKFIIYESRGARGYTGWADIISISKQKTDSIINKYGSNLIITPHEFKEYSKGHREMNVIEFENFEKFKNPVTPKSSRKFVPLGGKYIYKTEFEMIERKKN